MVHKFLSIVILLLIASCLLISCRSKNKDNGNAGADIGQGQDDSAPQKESADEKPDSSADIIPDNSESEKIPDNSESEQTPGDSENENLPEGENEDNPTQDNNEAEIPSGNGDNNEQTPEVNTPSVSVPIGTSVGYRFNDQTLRTVDGSYISTADLRGKIIVFNVWATWCSPCRTELPDFDEVASEYGDDVVIIAVHCYDEYQANVPGYVASNFPDTDIIFAYDNENSSAYYSAGGTRYVPQTAIIDRDGIIRYSDSGKLSYSALTSIIDDIL